MSADALAPAAPFGGETLAQGAELSPQTAVGFDNLTQQPEIEPEFRSRLAFMSSTAIEGVQRFGEGVHNAANWLVDRFRGGSEDSAGVTGSHRFLRSRTAVAGGALVAGTSVFAGATVAHASGDKASRHHATVGLGAGKRADCFANGSSKHIVFSTSETYADGARIKGRGRITNMANGKFAAPAFTVHTDSYSFKNVKFHTTERKIFPAGTLPLRLTFTVHQNGETYRTTFKGNSVDERGC